MENGETINREKQDKICNHVMYIVFDLLTIITELFLFEKLVANWDPFWTSTYFWIYLFFCCGIFLKRWDPDYINGIGNFGNKFLIVSVVSIYFFGLGLGGFALFSFSNFFFKPMPPIFIAIPAAFIFVFAYPVLFGFISKTKSGLVKKFPTIVLVLMRIISYSAIFLMNIYMLSFIYKQIEKFRENEIFPLWTYPLIIIIVALLILLFYLPARIHLFFQDPVNKGNYISFFITCAGLTIFAVTGMVFRF